MLAGSAADATVPGDNGRIAYHLYFNAKQTRGAIFTIDPDGSDRLQLTHPPRGVATARPDWSPDGRWIVYVRVQFDRLHPHPGPDPRLRIWKMRSDGTRQQPVSDACDRTVGCRYEDDPAWSPDGRWIAFTRLYEKDIHRGPEIMLMRTDGTHVHRVTNHATDHLSDWEVQWSPSGNRLVFPRWSEHHQGYSALITVRPDGTGHRRITPWMDVQYPDWSPDGRWILFSVGIDSPSRLWMVRPNGKRLHKVANGTGVGWISGSFSPDGTMTVWSRFGGIGDDGYPDVDVLDADGLNIENITQSETWESGPDWGIGEAESP
jgi:TolB protein